MKNKHILFLSHSELLTLDSIFAEKACQYFGYKSIVMVHGYEEYQKAEKLGFHKVVDISLSNEKIKISENKRDEIVKLMNKIDIEFGKGSIYEDILIDRKLNTRFSMDWILSYLLSVHQKVNEILNEFDIAFAVGEVNYASYRLARKILKINGIQYFMYMGTPFFKDRFFVDSSFHLKWKPFLRNLEITKEIPRKVRYQLEEIILQHQKGIEPSYTKIGREKGWDADETIIKKLKRGAVKRNIQYWKLQLLNNGKNKGLPFSSLKREMFLFGILARRLRQIYRKIVFKFLIAPPDLSKNYFVYFLHHTPEYTVDTLGGPYRDQIYLITKISERLPLNYVLYVKEHVGMVGLRDIKEYRAISRLPNVKLITNEIRSFDIIKKAKIVFTISGTPALEANMNDIPAIMFSNFFTSQISGILQCTNLFELSEKINTCLSSEINNRFSYENKLQTLYAIYRTSSKGALHGMTRNWKNNENIKILKKGFIEQIKQLKKDA